MSVLKILNITVYKKIITAYKKIIIATQEIGKSDESVINSIGRIDGRLMSQGAENDRGWTLVHSEQTGEMSAMVSDE